MRNTHRARITTRVSVQILACCAAAIAVVPTIAQAQAVFLEGNEARRYAAQRGWVVRRDSATQTMELQRIVNGIPLYYVTTNADAADTISTDEVLPGGSSGFDRDGGGVILGIWDAGAVRRTHREFTGRAAQQDAPPLLHDHATHVAGTMIAAGLDSFAKGMSPAAVLRCYDWNNDVAEMEAQGAELRVSNHSYGFSTGWFFNFFVGDWYWWGDVEVDEFEDYYFGFYDSTAAEWDQIAFDRPHYLIVKSAGNDRNDGPAPGTGHWYIDPHIGDWTWSEATRSLDGNNGYDSISHQGTAKNILTVGAVADIPGGYLDPADVRMSSFSCWGPTDDGRIKPDVVANGIELHSPIAASDNSYAEFSGTSMASPNASGSLGLLIEHFRATHNGDFDMTSATMKALLIHTADEAGGFDGPDYRFGWGLVNTLRAATTISDDVAKELSMSEHTLAEGGVFEVTVITAAGQGPLRATICWTDPAGEPPPNMVDPADRMLVNDLDLSLELRPDGTVFLPWILDPANPAAPATTGDNDVDNVEQVVVVDPGERVFTLRVTHEGSLRDGAQAFSLIVTGAESIILDCNENGMPDHEDINEGRSTDCNGNGVPDECDIDSGRSEDCNGNELPDECEFADCNLNCVPDEEDIANGTSEDCNENAIPDECDIDSGTSRDCNENGVPDECDLNNGTSDDCNANSVPDECEVDCNENGIPDDCDIRDGVSEDCNENAIPDECDIAGGESRDCDLNGIPDECEFADCNENCVPDEDDIEEGTSEDCNANGIPDECTESEEDFNQNGVPDTCENLELRGFIGQYITEEGAPAPGLEGEILAIRRSLVNSNKQVSFWAETSFREAIYVWTDGAFDLRVEQFTTAPGTEELFERLWNSIAFNDSATVAFSAELTGERARGLFISTVNGISPVIFHGDPLPDASGFFDSGFNESPIPCAITNDGVVYFRGLIVEAPDDVGESGAIFRYENGETTTIAATGVEYGNVGVFDVVEQGPYTDPGGTLVFRVRQGGLRKIVRYRRGELDIVVSQGERAPGSTGDFSRFDDRTVPVGPITTYFSADTSGNPDHGIFRSRLVDDIVPIVLEGDPAPVEGNTFVIPRNPIANPLGDVYFYSQLSSGDPPAGLFKMDLRTRRQSGLLLSGDPAPAAGGRTVDDVNGHELNPIGDIAILYRASDRRQRLIYFDQNLLGDFDHDDDVDIDDYTFFHECLRGPGEEPPAGCEEADFDQDGDVDVEDYAVMQDAYIECEQGGEDCNRNGVGDACELEGLIATDCDHNGILDECDVAFGGAPDCNVNWLPDACDIDSGRSYDFDENGEPDECQGFPDCNNNGIGDQFDIRDGRSEDCDEDEVPDDCQLRDGPPRLIGFTEGNIVRIDPADTERLEIMSGSNPLLPGMASACDGRLWGLGSNGDVFEIDSEGGQLTLLGANPGYAWDGAAFDCAEGVLYGITSDSPEVENGLFRVSMTDGSVELVGDVRRRVAGLAYHQRTDSLFGLMDGLLWRINSETGVPTLLCDNIFFGQTRSLAVDSDTLYTTISNQLYEIDADACEVALLGNLHPLIQRTEGMAFWRATGDCNENQVPDHCDIEDGTSRDVNENGIPDECEDFADCNENGIPDEDELQSVFRFDSPRLSPIGDGHPQMFTIISPPHAVETSPVVFDLRAYANLRDLARNLRLNVNGRIGSRFFDQGGSDCPEDPSREVEESLASRFNDALAGGDAEVVITATEEVDAFFCPEDTWVEVTIEYLADNDCNANEQLDECENGPDCNANNRPDECDIAYGFSADCNTNNLPDECESFEDCNDNGVPDECEPDCNENDIPDECDIRDGRSTDCNNNAVPDECEPDCNDNQRPDECDITDGTSEDCNENAIPDECDIAERRSEDENGNGVPDECEGGAAFLFWGDTQEQRIERATLDGGDRREIAPAEAPRGMDVDLATQRVYWSRSDSGGALDRANLDGSGLETLVTGIGSNLSDLALDPVNNRVLICQALGADGKIFRLNLDGGDQGVLVSGLEEPVGIAVDPVGGKVYWIEQRGLVIRRANLNDGTEIEDLVATTAGGVGFAVDAAADQMYWTLTTVGEIWHSRLDGSEAAVLISDVGAAAIELDLTGRRLFWTISAPNRIQRANVDGTNIEDVVLVTGRAGPIAIYPGT